MPGVDAAERQRGQAAIGGAVELHEHEVPDLEPPRTVLGVVGKAFRALGKVRAAVEVQLAAGSAGPGVAHPPEVLLVAGGDVSPPHEAIRREPDLFGPDPVRLVVIGVYGRGDARRSQPELLRQELPCPMDRLGLEVVAEGPVSEHLEQGLVARRPADLLEVVVLSRDAQAGLGIHRSHVVALLLPGQDTLERRHARVHEQQRRVVDGKQRRGRHARMPALLEEALEALADLGGSSAVGCVGSVMRHSRREPATHRLSLLIRLGSCGAVTGRRPRWLVVGDHARRAPARRRHGPR